MDFEAFTEEFYDYQLIGNEEIPPLVLESFKTERGDIRLDALWNYFGEMKDAADGTVRFPKLKKVVRLIITIPHSNAEEERVFSIVRKNKTCFRPRLDPEETLASIVTVKLAMESESVNKFKIPDEVLRDAKSATYKNKLEHCSSK